MRPALRWALGFSTLISAGAVLWLDGEESPVSPSETASTIPTRATPAGESVPSAGTLPRSLPGQILKATAQDPFASAALAPALAVSPPAPPPPEPPRPPPLAYHYLGQMMDPSGKKIVYLTKGDRDIQASVGTQLEDGYVVESITASAIRVLHTATQTRLDIFIPTTAESPQ